jgi:hypothetical protein
MIGRLPFRDGLAPTPISAAGLTLNVYRRIPKVISTSYLNELVQPAAGPKGPGRRAGTSTRINIALHCDAPTTWKAALSRDCRTAYSADRYRQQPEFKVVPEPENLVK